MDDTRELIMTCDACKKPIGDEEGWLWVDRTAAQDHGRAVREWEAEHQEGPRGAIVFDLTEVMELPEVIRWNAHHSGCDPEPDANAYTIESERIRSWADLTHWTAHLMEKPWLSSTDWRRLLDGIAQGSSTRLRPAKRSTLHA